MKKFLLSILFLPALLIADNNDCCFDDPCDQKYVSCEEFENHPCDVSCGPNKMAGAESFLAFKWVNTCDCICKYSLEFRVGGTQPANSRVNRIYGSSVEYELEWAWRQAFCSLDAWVNVSYLSKQGHVGDERLRSRLRLFPISFGLKRSFYLTENFSLYAGIGASYTFAQGSFFDNNHHTHKQSWGFVAKGGITYNFCNGIYLDFYGDYYYTGLRAHGDTLNVGGFRGGIGLGICF